MPSPLTARQEECLRLTRFKTDKEIAAELGLAEATVKKHVAEACQRLGVNRRKAALALLEQTDDASDPVSDVAGASSVAPSAGIRPLSIYRTPPKGLLPRAAIIGIMAVLLVLAVQATTTVIFEVHGQVDQIDKAVSPVSKIGAMPPLRP